jgi:hypothetical protein
MPPEFLNSREDAALLWVAVILAFVLYRDPRGVGSGFLSVVSAAFQHKLLLLFGLALAYSALLVYAASRADLWHEPALKATVFWFIGTAIVLVGGAVTDGSRDVRSYLRKVVRRVVAVTLVIEFMVGLYALPLVFEIVGVGVLLLFSMMQAYVQHDPATPAMTRTSIDVVLGVVGVVYIAYFAIHLLGNPAGFFTRANAEEFLVPPVLTVALVPLLLAWAWLSRREQEQLRRRFETRNSHA